MQGMSETATPRCLVTGGSSGIGWAIAARLCDEGWQVTSLSRREPAPDGVRAIAGDAAEPADLEAAIAAAAGPEGRLDGLVCAAGLPPSGPWDDPEPLGAGHPRGPHGRLGGGAPGLAGAAVGARLGRPAGQHRGRR